jgi:2-amino-4-hydroxy-6-hydroxymethyldihydropteridine diphosphokinase
MSRIILGLGSNVGKREKNLQLAVSLLAPELTNITLSSVLESKALLPEDAPADWDMAFYNMALSAETALGCKDLLAFLKDIEVQIGRKKQGHWSPREIDIDILAYGGFDLETKKLQIPHPHLLERDFALLPFAELWPDWCYPLEGAYRGWRACDIVTDKGYGYSDDLKKTDITLYAG